MNRRRVRWTLLGMTLLTLACVRQVPGPELLVRADALVLDHKPDDALPLLKQYLQANPCDAGAHYLLGYCYRTVQPAWLTIADGEFETALYLVKRTGECGRLNRFQSADALELEIHRCRALTGMQWLLEAMDRRVRREYVERLAEQTMKHVQEGLHIDPNHPELREMEHTLRFYIEGATPPVPEPKPSPPPPASSGWAA